VSPIARDYIASTTFVGGGATSGTTQKRSFDWPAPMQGPSPVRGCFCVRGTVTDAAGQSATVTATKPVKF
jgi:hypothetical protein